MDVKRILRSLLAVVVGVAAISFVVEALEFTLVAAARGGSTEDPELYFAVRNRPWFLALKLVYNTAAAVAAGYLAAWIAGRAPLGHGVVVVLLQTVALYGLKRSRT